MVPERSTELEDASGSSGTEEPPSPPESIPQYLVDGVGRQGSETLEELSDWIDEVVEHRRGRKLETDQIIGEEEKIVDRLAEEDIEGDVGEGGEGGTVVLKEIPCGKEGCGACPHGPYAYRAYWRDGSTRTEYLGRADEVVE